VFEFDPIPAEQQAAYAGTPDSISYLANFIALDGSGATLSFHFADFYPYGFLRGRNTPDRVFYNAADNEFGYPGAIASHSAAANGTGRRGVPGGGLGRIGAKSTTMKPEMQRLRAEYYGSGAGRPVLA
jgi:hypothetical protein